jgi:hypothetical protein
MPPLLPLSSRCAAYIITQKGNFSFEYHEYSRRLMMEKLSYSETSILTRATRRNIPEEAFCIVTAVKTSNLKQD